MSGLFVKQALPSDTISETLEGKDITICCQGGLLESFFSLPFIELVSLIGNYKTLSWCGPEVGKEIVRFQGLVSSLEGEELDWSRYPTPWVLKGNDLFWNATYACFNGTSPKDPDRRIPRYAAISSQILSNLLGPYSSLYQPRFRKLKYSSEKQVIYIPSSKEKVLGWGREDVIRFREMLRLKGLDLKVCEKPKEWIPLLESAKAIVAEDIGNSILSLLVSKADLVGRPFVYGETHTFDLSKNKKWLDAPNSLFLNERFCPEVIANWIYKKGNKWKIKSPS